jgi:hypothetical protein
MPVTHQAHGCASYFYFRPEFSLKDAIGSHACSLEGGMCVIKWHAFLGVRSLTGISLYAATTLRPLNALDMSKTYSLSLRGGYAEDHMLRKSGAELSAGFTVELQPMQSLLVVYTPL